MNASNPDTAPPAHEHGNGNGAHNKQELGAEANMVVHTRARALLEWLAPQVAQWPREHRHTLARHSFGLAMQVHDLLVAARHLDADNRALALRDADIALDQLRQYLQLAWRWQWLSAGQYQHVSALTAELGRLVGGWRRSGRTHPEPGTQKSGRAGLNESA